MQRLCKTLALVWAISTLTESASAALVDWSAVTWSPGSLSNSYDVDPGNAGNDITITVSGDTGQLQPMVYPPNPQTPAITTNFQGGLVSPANTLSIAIDLQNQNEAITLTVDFSALYAQGVNYVSFQLFDVDFSTDAGSNYQDEIRNITALSIDGSTVIAPTITISPNNTLSGSGVNQVVDGIVSTADTGAGSGAANVTIDFGAAAIKSFTFTYGSGSGISGQPTYEHIGLYNIDYSVVPEPGALGACLVVVGMAVWRSHRRSRRLSG